MKIDIKKKAFDTQNGVIYSICLRTLALILYFAIELQQYFIQPNYQFS